MSSDCFCSSTPENFDTNYFYWHSELPSLTRYIQTAGELISHVPINSRKLITCITINILGYKYM